jgi:hypothetical protein
MTWTNTPPLHPALSQLLDNALVAAGLLDDPRSMLPRLNDILEASLRNNGN